MELFYLLPDLNHPLSSTHDFREGRKDGFFSMELWGGVQIWQ